MAAILVWSAQSSPKIDQHIVIVPYPCISSFIKIGWIDFSEMCLQAKFN